MYFCKVKWNSSYYKEYFFLPIINTPSNSHFQFLLIPKVYHGLYIKFIPSNQKKIHLKQYFQIPELRH